MEPRRRHGRRGRLAPAHDHLLAAGQRRRWTTLLKPYPAERMRGYPISTRVNSVENDDAGLLDPMMAGDELGTPPTDARH